MTLFDLRFQFVTLRFACEAPGSFVSSFALVDCIGLDLRSHFDRGELKETQDLYGLLNNEQGCRHALVVWMNH